MQVLSSFHCARTIESLLFTSVRSNLYSSGIRARQLIIHTCLQQKSTCNLGFLLSHLQVYTPSAQLHHIQKAINRSWNPFSCVVQGVLKSHMKGKTVILYPSFCVYTNIVSHKHASSVHPLSKAADRSIYSNSVTPTWPPFFRFSGPWLQARLDTDAPTRPTKLRRNFLLSQRIVYIKHYFLLSHNLIYTTELRRQGSP